MKNRRRYNNVQQYIIRWKNVIIIALLALASPTDVVVVVQGVVVHRWSVLQVHDDDDNQIRPKRRSDPTNAALYSLRSSYTTSSNHWNNNNNKELVADKRIVGGKPVSDASLFPSYAFTAGIELCGATIIHPDILLTAAHCNGAFGNGILHGGLNIGGSDSSFINVEKEFPHPEYSEQTDANDIMLVKLASPSSAPLQKLNFDPSFPGDDVTTTVIGFGNTAEDGDVSNVLLQVNVETTSHEFCNTVFGKIIQEIMICAGGNGQRDSCQGDSGACTKTDQNICGTRVVSCRNKQSNHQLFPGGPLLAQDGRQIGIVSFGAGCAREGTPAVYARVSGFESWIRQGICDLSAQPPNDCTFETSPPSTSLADDPPSLAPSPSNQSTTEPTMSPSKLLISTFAPVTANPTTPTSNSNTTTSPTVQTTLFPTLSTPMITSVPTSTQPTTTLKISPTAQTTIFPTFSSSSSPTSSGRATTVSPTSYLSPQQSSAAATSAPFANNQPTSHSPTVGPIPAVPTTLSPPTLPLTIRPTLSPSTTPLTTTRSPIRTSSTEQPAARPKPSLRPTTLSPQQQQVLLPLPMTTTFPTVVHRITTAPTQRLPLSSLSPTTRYPTAVPTLATTTAVPSIWPDSTLSSIMPSTRTVVSPTANKPTMNVAPTLRSRSPTASPQRLQTMVPSNNKAPHIHPVPNATPTFDDGPPTFVVPFARYYSKSGKSSKKSSKGKKCKKNRKGKDKHSSACTGEKSMTKNKSTKSYNNKKSRRKKRS